MVALLLISPAASRAMTAHLDPTFGTDGVTVRSDPDEDLVYPFDLFVEPDGRLIVVGDRFLKPASAPNFRQTAFGYTPDGQPDPGFGPNGDGTVDITSSTDSPLPRGVMLSDGRMVFAWVQSGPTGYRSSQIRLLRLLPNGAPDPAFGSDGIVDTGIGPEFDVDLAVTPDDRLVLATSLVDDQRLLLVRLLADGSVDSSFSDDGSVMLTDPNGSLGGGPIAVSPDGNITVAAFAWGGGAGADAGTLFVRVDSDGTIDPDFHTRIYRRDGDVYDVAPAGSDKVV